MLRIAASRSMLLPGMGVCVAVTRTRKPVTAAAAPKSGWRRPTISPAPSNAAKSESPVMDSNWFWIAKRSAMMQRRVKPTACSAIATNSSPPPNSASRVRPVETAVISTTAESTYTHMPHSNALARL